MKTKIMALCFVSLFVLACSSSKTKATPEQIQELDELVTSQSFKIESEWAVPQTSSSLIALQNSGILAPGDNAGRVSLIGNPNFLKLDGESIDSKLPYFGERQMVNRRNDNGSIEFESTIKNFEVEQHKNSSYTIKFDAKSHNENYNVIIRLYPNMRSEMILKGAKRFPIRYTGYVSKLPQ